jgi:colicin import membrane protein
MDKQVYTVDLLSLAPPPPPKPTPIVEAAPEIVAEPQVPVVEAALEPAVEVKPTPVVEAKQEPKVEKISEKKVEKKIVVKKQEEKPKPKPRPKPKPKKTAAQLRKEALAAAQTQVRTQTRQKEAAKAKALRDELAALKQKEGDKVYSHGGQGAGVEGGVEEGVQGATGSGLSEVYSLIVGLAIKKNWRYPSFAGEDNLMATVEISLDEEGKIRSFRIIDSSGNVEFDNSTLRAIKETEQVERPRTDRDRVLHINFNSQELSE